MSVVFLNRFYWPDETATAQLLTDLAEGLAAGGRSVTVITSRPAGGGASEESRRGVRILRIGSTRTGRPGVVAKALDFATFFAGALRRLLGDLRPGDAVVALTDPPLIGAGAWLVARLRRARSFHWVQDLYPEIAIAVSGREEWRVLRPWRDRAWRAAAGCVSLGQAMDAAVGAAGVPAARRRVVPNWAPAGLTPPALDETGALRAAWGVAGRLVVGYSGNLGRVHDLAPVLDLASALAGTPDIVFLFVGSGAQRAGLVAAAQARQLTNVHFRPAQPRAALAATLGAADVHLVTLRPECAAYVFPSKIYGIAAVGRPVLFIGPRASEPARTVVAGGFGQAFERSEIAAMAEFLRGFSAAPARATPYRDAARRFSAAQGGAAAAAAVWDELLGLPAPAAGADQPHLVL